MTQEVRAEALRVAYGPVQAVREVTFAASRGRVVALLGQNGAGKTSLLKALSGLVRPKDGRVILDDKDVTRRGPAERLAAGLSHVPEGRRLFVTETVYDNLLVGGHLRRRSGGLHAKAQALLGDVPALKGHHRRQAGLLSGGQQQLVAILRGLMSDPHYLLLDEPFNGLAPTAREDVGQLIRDIAAAGAGVVVVEQLAAAVLPIADDVVVMNNGRVVLTGDGAELRDGAAVYDAYLGNHRSEEET
ncbi:ATP-binding cassette domain-containing protein [Spirillospora sp. NPDC048819]|uniref:ABC transporter ATP-binding protein n=1 Tax=Spirillospora sp. NPDC048819 TaxID=3155268 RepID=UPI003407E55A